MGKLTDQMKEMIAEIRPGLIATADRNGRPNVSAKGSFRVLDDDHLLFADISSPGTIANLRENPKVSAIVLHPKTMRGCRVWGTAEILDSGELVDRLSEEFTAKGMKVNHVVKITVEEAKEGV